MNTTPHSNSTSGEAPAPLAPPRSRRRLRRLLSWLAVAGFGGLLLAVFLWNTEFGRKWLLSRLVLALAPSSIPAASVTSDGRAPAGRVFEAVTFGAIPDDGQADTQAIQSAIRACAAAGGGRVRVTGGEFLAGQLELASGVTLVVEAGSVLRASRTRKDFPNGVWLRGVGLKDAGVCGPGRLAGDGFACFDVRLANMFAWNRGGKLTGQMSHPVTVKATPFTYLIQFVDCQDVRVERLLIEDSPSWTIHTLVCDGVRIEGVTINNLLYGPYTDGIDIDSSSRVLVKDCLVTAGDDAFCVKSTNKQGRRRPARDIVFENCRARSPTNGFKIGTETQDEISDVTFRDCRVEPPLPGVLPLAGLNLASVDGTCLRRVTVENMTMTAVRCPLFIRLGLRGRDVPPEKLTAGLIDGVTITGLTVEESRQPITIAGLDGHPVRNVRLARVTVRRQAGAFASRALRDIPELPAAYPESPMFGTLPATGLFARHCAGLVLESVALHHPDDAPVPALATVNVTGLEGGLVQP
jgi:polygalacturonase